MGKQKTLEDAIKLEKITKHFNEHVEELRKLHGGKNLDETYEYDDYYLDIPHPAYSAEEIAYIAANDLYIADDDDADDADDKVNEAKNVVLKPSPNIKRPGNPPAKGDVLWIPINLRNHRNDYRKLVYEGKEMRLVIVWNVNEAAGTLDCISLQSNSSFKGYDLPALSSITTKYMQLSHDTYLNLLAADYPCYHDVAWKNVKWPLQKDYFSFYTMRDMHPDDYKPNDPEGNKYALSTYDPGHITNYCFHLSPDELAKIDTAWTQLLDEVKKREQKDQEQKEEEKAENGAEKAEDNDAKKQQPDTTKAETKKGLDNKEINAIASKFAKQAYRRYR